MPATIFWETPGTGSYAWDYIQIGGHVYPVRDVESDAGRKLDSKSPKGGDGGSITDNGFSLSKVTFTLRAWTAAHLADLDALMAILDPERRLKDRQPITVHHPALVQLGITRIFVERVGTLKASSTHGLYEQKVTAIRYKPATKRNVSHRAGVPTDASGQVTDPGVPSASEVPNASFPISSGSNSGLNGEASLPSARPRGTTLQDRLENGGSFAEPSAQNSSRPLPSAPVSPAAAEDTGPALFTPGGA